MVIDTTAQKESTLLAIIAQAEAGGATRTEVAKYERLLVLASSRKLVQQIFEGHPNARGFRSWARSLKRRPH